MQFPFRSREPEIILLVVLVITASDDHIVDFQNHSAELGGEE